MGKQRAVSCVALVKAEPEVRISLRELAAIWVRGERVKALLNLYWSR